MSTIPDPGFPTLANVVKRMKPDGGIETMLANTLTKKMPLLEDMPWVEGNLPTGHRITGVNVLPSVSWRKLNQGLAATKAQTQQYDEACGLMEAWSKVDIALAELNGNEAAYRATEDKVFLEAFNQELNRALFYESITNPERIQGLAARYPKSSGYTASGYVQLVGSPGGSSCQSIWLINWDPERVFGVFPKASVAGLQMLDWGRQLVLDSSSNQFGAYVTQFKWKVGIAVKDYRYVGRIQWDTTDGTNGVDSAKALPLAMENMLSTVYEVLPSARWYMSRTSYKKFNAQCLSNDNRLYAVIEEGGRRIPSFMGVPIRYTDSLTSETALS